MEDIETLIQMILANYQLPIEIEHALPDWPLVDYRKYSSETKKAEPSLTPPLIVDKRMRFIF
jgi:hypothetical protein